MTGAGAWRDTRERAKRRGIGWSERICRSRHKHFNYFNILINHYCLPVVPFWLLGRRPFSKKATGGGRGWTGKKGGGRINHQGKEGVWVLSQQALAGTCSLWTAFVRHLQGSSS